MKKYKYLIYLFSILVVSLMAYFIYNSFAKENEENLDSKVIAEISYFERQLLSLFNQMNNIKFESYKINSSIADDESENNSNSNNSSNGSSSSNKNSSSENSNNSSDKLSNQSTSNNVSINKKYELQNSGILTQNSEANWQNVKNQVENIYVLLSTITLDLYQTEINKDDILRFNSEFDGLTKAVKDENKEQTLLELSYLYDYLPNFIDKCNVDNNSKVILKTKNNILKAYAIIDKADWETINNHINNAIQNFTNLITSTENNTNKHSSINKAFIRINELKNATALKDREVFLIKYKNLLDDLENI